MLHDRFMALYFPYWSSDLAKRRLRTMAGENDFQSEPEKEPKRKSENKRSLSIGALALTSKQNQQMQIRALCPQAQQAGIGVGMNAAVAQALCPNLQLQEFNPLKDFQALYILARWSLRFSPLVALDSELVEFYKQRNFQHLQAEHWGIVLNIRGTKKLYQEQLLAGNLLQALQHRGLQARVAIAPTQGAAWALSRFRMEDLTIVDDQSSIRANLEELPVSALRLAPQVVTALYELGVEKISELLVLPRKKLLQRFGVLLLKRIDQALSLEPEPLQSIKPAAAIQAERCFEVPISSQQALQVVVEVLLQDVLSQLDAINKRANLFILKLKVLNPDYSCRNCKYRSIQKELALQSAHMENKDLISVLQPSIESLQIPGSIVQVRLLARVLERRQVKQFDIYAQAVSAGSEKQIPCVQENNQESDQENTAQLLNKLVLRLGHAEVQTLTFCPSHIPERAYSYRALAPLASSLSALKSSAKISASYALKAAPLVTENTCLPIDRPSYFLPYPQPARAIAMLPDKPPAWLCWKNKQYRIVKGLGPEKISSEWWQQVLATEGLEQELSQREYFKLQTQEGLWLWVFRESVSGAWFVQGVWS